MNEYTHILMTNEKRKHKALRERTPDLVLAVLSRAQGLELLEYSDGVHQTVEVFSRRRPTSPDEDFVGVSIGHDRALHFTYLVTHDVEYPVAGYPEAYQFT